MKVRVLRKKPNELRIEIEGEGHTFCNALQKVLLEDEAVEMGGYDMPHPLVSSPTFYVRTKGNRRPESVLGDAAKNLQRQNSDFRKAFEKAAKAWQKKK